MKRIAVLCILFVCATTVCFGQTNQTESLTIATYYPSASGVYTNLRLSPTTAVPDGAAKKHGSIYYNSSEDTIKYYNNTNEWVNLTGGTSTGGYWIYNSSTQDISNVNWNGTVDLKGNAYNDELLIVMGDMRVRHPASDSIFYLTRTDATRESALIFNTWTGAYDVFKIYMKWGYPSEFIIGNDTNDSIVFDQGGNVTIGGPRPDGWINKLYIKGNTSAASPVQTLLRLEGDGEITLNFRGASMSGEPHFYPYRSRGSRTSPTKVLANDSLFFLKVGGYNGTVFHDAASIQFAADRNFTDTDSPVRISFNTTPVGSTIPVERLVSKYNNTIGIGEPNPQYALVIRNGAVYGYVNSTGHWREGSDKRIKKNISGIEDALAKVLRVKGIRYDSISDKSSIAKKGRYFGFIGQDLEKVMPELVETDAQGYKGVLYSRITPVLVEAIKDNQKDIESLRKEIEALKAQE